VKYIYDTDPPTVEMTRRNLAALLVKLDDPASARTLMSPSLSGEPVILVTAVEDAVHYGDRAAGDVVMPTSGMVWGQPAVAGYGARLAGLLEDLVAQRYQPDSVADLVAELREVLGVPVNTWVPIEGLDDLDTGTPRESGAADGGLA
jgi:hypothetical protein